MATNETTKRVSVEMLCLTLLQESDMYGYEMSQEIFKRSGDVIYIPEGSLYITMYKLVEKKYISDRKELAGGRGTRVRVYYHLEDAGREHLKVLLEDYNKTKEGIERFFDESKQK